MKEQVLGASDRAALQSLIPLAGALGAGTIFALFFGGRRHRTGLAVFEVFAIVSVLVAVGTTAYLSIALLHADAAITDRMLAQTASPLIVAVFVLVLVSIAGRLPGSIERFFAILPLVLIAALVSALLASSSWEAEPAGASVFALALLGVGAVLALIAAAADRLYFRWDRRSSQGRMARIVAAGYVPERRPLVLALPEVESGEERQPLACWNRRGRVYLDAPTLCRLRDLTDRRWSQLESAEALPPRSRSMLLGLGVRLWPVLLRRRASATLKTLDEGESRERSLQANEDGLFDVTDARLLG